MRRGRSYTRETLGPCAVCWREVCLGEPCTWCAPRRTWQHTACGDARYSGLAAPSAA